MNSKLNQSLTLDRHQSTGMWTSDSEDERTKIVVMKPVNLPANYLLQIATLLKKHLGCEMEMEQLAPYINRAYEKFFLLTSADASRVHGFAGLRILEKDNLRLAYVGAVVIDSGMRGGNRLYTPMARALICEKLRHPFQKLVVFGGMVNPYAYAALARRTGSVLPSPQMPDIPPELKSKVIWGLQELYGFEDALFDEDRGLLKPTIHLEPRQETPLDTSNPHLSFFEKRNPQYKEGVALLYAAPLTMRNLCKFLARFTSRRYLMGIGRTFVEQAEFAVAKR